MRVATPNDPKLSDGRGWRDRCTVGGKAAAEAAGVTAAPVRCSAWLGVAVIWSWSKPIIQATRDTECIGAHQEKEQQDDNADKRDEKWLCSAWQVPNAVAVSSDVEPERLDGAEKDQNKRDDTQRISLASTREKKRSEECSNTSNGDDDAKNVVMTADAEPDVRGSYSKEYEERPLVRSWALGLWV